MIHSSALLSATAAHPAYQHLSNRAPRINMARNAREALVYTLPMRTPSGWINLYQAMAPKHAAIGVKDSVVCFGFLGSYYLLKVKLVRFMRTFLLKGQRRPASQGGGPKTVRFSRGHTTRRA